MIEVVKKQKKLRRDRITMHAVIASKDARRAKNEQHMKLDDSLKRLIMHLVCFPDCEVRYGAGRCAVRAGRCAGRAARPARAARFARRPRLSGRARRDE